MADMVSQRDAANVRKQVVASAFTSLTAAGTGDNTAVTGITLDRQSIGVGGSVRFDLNWEATLAATKTLSLLAPVVQDSADGSAWATYTPPNGALTAPGVVATGAATLTRGVTAFSVGLSSARRYVRLNWTPDLSNTATDTATVVCTASFGGFDRLPPA